MAKKIFKSGIRAVGLAESFVKGERCSCMAGVVMRPDFFIDGFRFTFLTVGGMDSTEKIIKLVRSFKRNDIHVILLSGCVISWFNVVSLKNIHEKTGLPVICLTYNESEGLEKYFREYFPDSFQERIEVYKLNGERRRVRLKNGLEIYVRVEGLDLKQGLRVLNLFTRSGKKPEPIRVARIIAREVRGIPGLTC